MSDEIRQIKAIAQTYSPEVIESCITQQVETGKNVCLTDERSEEIISQLSKASVVREIMNQGMSLADALRELARRMRLLQSGFKTVEPDITNTRKGGSTMAYTAKDYSKLIGMEGFSETLLKNHFTLYQGYVTNTNKVLDALDQMVKDDKGGTPEFAELKRRLGWEFNGMRLHELYFENLGGKAPIETKSTLVKKMSETFGSYDAWEKDFKATGAMRGIGWTALYQDTAGGRLINLWINEHDVSHPAGCVPLLIMDVFEHAFMLDYGLKRADYIAAFFRNIDWSSVEARLK